VIDAEATPVKDDFQSGQKTAKKAAEILVSKKLGFIVPSAKQKLNLLIAFAKKGKVVYGKAFDIVKLSGPVTLDDLQDVEANLANVTIYEIKSTRKNLKSDFSNYFLSLTGAEVLVAQSLKTQFKFALVNTSNREHMELDLRELFGRARGIYPGWSLML
jgi:hypothetical protein